jgi:hypothetical protein
MRAGTMLQGIQGTNGERPRSVESVAFQLVGYQLHGGLDMRFLIPTLLSSLHGWERTKKEEQTSVLRC